MPANDFYAPGLMDLAPYRLERGPADAAWAELVENAATGTVFALPAFLEGLPFRLGLWWVLKRDEPVAVVPLVETEDGRGTRAAPHVIHGGPVIRRPPPEQGQAQAVSEAFRIVSAVVRDLTAAYRVIEFAAAPELVDLRPFAWVNHGREGPQAVFTPRWTTVLDLAPFPAREADSPLYRAAAKSRRQEIRYARAAGVTVEAGGEIGAFLELHSRTFARQGLAVPEEEEALLRGVLGSLEAAGRLRVFSARTAAGDLGSMALFGLCGGRAWYLYGASDPELRDGHTGSLVLWDAFAALAAEGVTRVDLEGINSPARGYFKLSFGGRVVPYMRVRLDLGG